MNHVNVIETTDATHRFSGSLRSLACDARDLKPEARGAAISATLNQLADVAPESDLGLFEVAAILAYLGTPRPDDDKGPTFGRRATCAELAAIDQGARGMPAGDWRGRGAAAWAHMAEAILDKAKATCSTADDLTTADPRLMAIYRTLSRESCELRQASVAVIGNGRHG